MSEQLKPCPLCGELPEVSSVGTTIDFECCECGISMSLQKSDFLTHEERETWEFHNRELRFSDDAERKAMVHAVELWNRRPGECTLRRLREVETESYRLGMLLLSEIVAGLAAKSEFSGVLCSVCRHNNDSHGMNCMECCPVKDAERRVAANAKTAPGTVPELCTECGGKTAPGTVPELCTECGGNIADDECQCAEAKQ